jgi:hypothetical protein
MNTLSDMTTVELTPEAATLFIEFQRRYSIIEALEKLHVFDIRGGSFTVHFDSLGRVGTIEKQEFFKS